MIGAVKCNTCGNQAQHALVPFAGQTLTRSITVMLGSLKGLAKSHQLLRRLALLVDHPPYLDQESHRISMPCAGVDLLESLT